ncbi:hypothetical protein [Candidatus Pantoea bituminis]|uniref:hypothetical protein n=1 Tax=Candidatus Pantoea bituminis TaxID=2831036 RepID=UPI001C0601B1|nr:hypothetical protein [Pantoea bituminis]
MTYESDVERSKLQETSTSLSPVQPGLLRFSSSLYKVLSGNNLLLWGTLILFITFVAVCSAGLISHSDPGLQSLDDRVQPLLLCTGLVPTN